MEPGERELCLALNTGGREYLKSGRTAMPGCGPQQGRLSHARLAKHHQGSAMLTDLVDQVGQRAQLPVPPQ